MSIFTRMFCPPTRGFGASATALVLVAGCGETVADRFPIAPTDSEDPYGHLETQGDESAMRATGSCSLSIAAPPSVDSGGAPDAECACTRRAAPQGDQSACVPGADWGVTATIGPEGGNILLRRTPFLEQTAPFGVLLRIPAGALSEPTTIRIIETSVTPPAGIADASPVYAFEPLGLAFATPASLEMPWLLASSTPSDPVTIFWSTDADPCSLEPIADNDFNFEVNHGTVHRLGWAAVGLPPARVSPACP